MFDVLIELEHQVIRAVQTRDMDALERLVGEDFTLTTGRPGKEVRSRDEWMRVTELVNRPGLVEGVAGPGGQTSTLRASSNQNPVAALRPTG